MNDTSKVRIFLESLPEQKRRAIYLQFVESIETLKEKGVNAVQDQSHTELRQAVHDLKTLSRLISELELADLCEQTEKLAVENSPEAFELFRTLETRINTMQQTLADYGKEMSY